MSAIAHKNLQEICRACLRTLKNSSQNGSESRGDGDSGGGAQNFHNLLIPNLCKLFMFFTTYDISNEYEDFPKRLCEWCYGKLMDYDEFRKAALKSTEMLYDVWNARQLDDKKNVPKNAEHQMESQLARVKSEPTETDEDDDNKLLLPELANMPLNIKPEPFFEAMEPQFTLPSFMEEGEVNQDQSSYESNDSEEDADDEELLLPSGAANNSSPSIYTSDCKPAKPKRIRDRNKKSIYCNICNKQFYKQVYLDAHIRGTHLGEEKPFQCSECTKSFTRYKQLFLHTQSKHLENRYRCNFPNCDAIFPGTVKLQTHRRMVHNLSNEQNSIDYLQEGQEEMDHTCHLCWRKYSSSRALREHIKRHNQIKEHVCPECGVAKVTRTELQTHMRIHTPNLEKFPCPQCPQVFNHKNAISRHIKVIHEGVKRFQCSYCLKRFGTRNSQVCHERLHTGERPYTCDICQKAFVQQEGLRSHMKNHDKNLRTHICKYCSQRFITLRNLLDHEKRHTSDKPHICILCSKGFYNEEDLQIHRSSHFEAVGPGDQDVAVEPDLDSSSPSSKEDTMNSTF